MAIPFITQLPEAPQRSDARPDFALRADVFFAAIDPMRYQMNQMAAWMNDQRDDIYSYSDNVEAWMNTTLAARNAAQTSATNAAASEVAAKKHLDDTRELINNFDITGDLPAASIKNAPLVVATDQGGVRFSDRALNNGAGVRPTLRFDFANQGYLDPRIEFTRASADWDWEGREYGIDEPVLTDEGLWVSGSRTNLLLQSRRPWLSPWASGGSLYFNLQSSEIGPVPNAQVGFCGPRSGVPSFTNPPASQDVSLSAGRYVLSGFFKPINPNGLMGSMPTIRSLTRAVSGKSGEAGSLIYRLYGNGGFRDEISEGTGVFGQSRGIECLPVGGGWFRCSETFELKESATVQIRLFPYNFASAFTGDGETGLLRTALQLEAGEVATPYIPTEDSQVTVAAARVNFSIPFSGDVFSTVTSYKTLTLIHLRRFITLVGESEVVGLTSNSALNAGGYYLIQTTPSLELRNASINPSLIKDVRAALSFDGTTYRASANGATQELDGQPAGVLLSAHLGESPTGGAKMTGFISSFSFYKQALTIEQLQGLTS